ncbi:unnamed protein product [Polarella glacialis]|uniref:Alpha N-terminal protein methyltransferase 1 n=1 Tax=Polarella glacialis TaxID=89957 RepID=A0A813G496_POLGL|nr:unnamed protein product [Polarella glacialis]
MAVGKAMSGIPMKRARPARRVSKAHEPGLMKKPSGATRRTEVGRADLKRKREAGSDSTDRNYADISSFWCEVRDTWYTKVSKHWNSEEASIRGVLGGLPETHGPDVRESSRFLKHLKKSTGPPGFTAVLDCGAGVGRVTRGLLSKFFKEVDLVEPNKRLLDTARRELKGLGVARFFCSSLQRFKPAANRYDVIWIQWVFLHLKDDDIVEFLRRCGKCLKSGGMICIKDNVVLKGGWYVDRSDLSIARADLSPHGLSV